MLEASDTIAAIGIYDHSNYCKLSVWPIQYSLKPTATPGDFMEPRQPKTPGSLGRRSFWAHLAHLQSANCKALSAELPGPQKSSQAIAHNDMI